MHTYIHTCTNAYIHTYIHVKDWNDDDDNDNTHFKNWTRSEYGREWYKDFMTRLKELDIEALVQEDSKSAAHRRHMRVCT
jgi:hypothetical protein